jgi:putative sterol carrier protein
LSPFGRFRDTLSHAWNAFTNLENRYIPANLGASYSHRPDRTRLRLSNERSIISAIYTRISIDVASIDMRHVRVDDEHQYLEEIKSGLNECLTLEANLDQEARDFRQDIVLSLFDEGDIAIVPVDTTINPALSGSFDIKTLRIGRIVQWYPKHVRVELYNDDIGRREEVTLEKSYVGIVHNPLYTMMNEQNSTLQRLIRKLNLLDAVDEAASSGKLDLIIQLPYTIRSEARRQQAEQRRKDIEFQLTNGKYGIAYADGTEKVIQLNRPAENQLLAEVEYLTKMLYGQLGITEEVMNGTADEKTMLNYINRTVEPILGAITGAMKRSFLTKTGRSQGQSIMYFRDPFKLVPLEQIAEIADKFARNEITSANDIRPALGLKPSKDPKANELRNSNMPQPEVVAEDPNAGMGLNDDQSAKAFGDLEAQLDSMMAEFGVTADVGS